MKQLIPYFILSKSNAGIDNSHFYAYTMFIDLSGFTPLTEKLMEKGVEGAEEISFVINNIFAPLVNLVYQKDGFIPYFAGDAFLAIFPKEESRMDADSFFKTAYALQKQFNNKELIEAKLGKIDIGVKIGLSVGKVSWGIVGKENIKTYYFRGEAIDGAVQAQSVAANQQIVFDQLLFAKIQQKYHIKKVDQQHFLMDQEFGPLAPSQDSITFDKTIAELTHQFLPDAILDSDIKGEFRNVISIFISFSGLSTHDEMNDFAKVVLEEVKDFSGYFKEIDFSDKGGLMVIFFGAPVSFENNEQRALEFVLGVRTKIQQREFSNLKFRVGMTNGVAYTGMVGGDEMSQYAVVGTSVNLAARLMGKAEWGEVLVDEEIQRTPNFKFEEKGNIKYKGIQTPIATYQYLGKGNREEKEYNGQLIGRSKEVESLQRFTEPMLRKQFAGITSVFGEAGVGKTRLIHELTTKLKSAGKFKKFVCKADQILRKPLNPFIYFLRNYFGQQSELSDDEKKIRFERVLNQLYAKTTKISNTEIAAEFKNELIRLKSVLGALLGISYPGSLWGELDAKGRLENTYQALALVFQIESTLQPLMIVLEDAHWFDDSSIAFLNDLVKKFYEIPIAVVVLSRYLDDGSIPDLFDPALIQASAIKELKIDLNLLSKSALADFVADRLGGASNDNLLKLLHRSTNGNPFYVEQMLEYISESNLITNESGEWDLLDKDIKMSNSIRSILIARIDRLSSILKETVKAAAVIGTEFEVPVLSMVMQENKEYLKEDDNINNVLRDQIQTAEKGQIWKAVNELRYIFKHSLMRETVYDMQLRAQLREAHTLVAHAIEKLYDGQLEEKYIDLAYHYEQTENEEKSIEYFKKAADYARGNFQNNLAVSYYNKLITLLELKPTTSYELARACIRKGEILEQNGSWEGAEDEYNRALQISSTLNDKVLSGRTNNALGNLNILKGNYDAARNFLEVAVTWFEEMKDETGIAKVYGNLGNLYLRQGDYKKAIDYFDRSIRMSDRNNEKVRANIVSSLGLAHMNLGNYKEGIETQEAHLAIAERNKDKLGMATLYTNTGIVYFESGDYNAAMTSYEKGLKLSEELGNKFLMSIAIGSMGTVNQERGEFDEAMRRFRKDLALVEEMGDKQGIAIVNGLLGELLNVLGEFQEASKHLELNLKLSRELGYQKGIAKATNALADVCINKEEYSKAIELYDEAIEISEKIGNKSVLAHCLIEKTNAELLIQQLGEAEKSFQKSKQLVDELGNPALIFQFGILQSRIERRKGQYEEANSTLLKLLETYTAKKEQAMIYLELYKLSTPEKETYRKEALQLFETLYASTPQHKYKLTINELKKG